VSGIEDEFRLSAGKPRLVYVKDPAEERERRLTELLDTLQAEGSASYKSFERSRASVPIWSAASCSWCSTTSSTWSPPPRSSLRSSRALARIARVDGADERAVELLAAADGLRERLHTPRGSRRASATKRSWTSYEPLSRSGPIRDRIRARARPGRV
jgi:hypothetical protein